MRLLDYMKSKGFDDLAFAERCGGRATALAVRKWKYGETHPRIPELVRIEEVTGGDVKPIDFLLPRRSREGRRRQL